MKVIILIAIAEKDLDCIGEVLSRLLTIVESPMMITQMLDAKSRSALALLLQEVLKEPYTTGVKEELC